MSGYPIPPGPPPESMDPEPRPAEIPQQGGSPAATSEPQVLPQDAAIAILRTLGFRIRSTGEYAQVVRNFQRAWNLGNRLAADSVVGPQTSDALRISAQRHREGKPDVSSNFSFSEFACQCRGKHVSCARIVLRRELLESLETYRKVIGKPVSIKSGYRCPKHNASIKGAGRKSQHLYGTAADFPDVLTTKKVESMHIFAGIGRRASGLVVHGDRRDISDYKPGGTLEHPARWKYSW